MNAKLPMPFLRCSAIALAALTLCGGALAADPVKVGLALDISGPFAAGGAEARDGINLAIKLLGNKLGGQPAEFVQADTAGSPDQAKQVVDRMIQRDKIDFFTGPTPSNVALAVGPTLFAAKVPYITSNPGPSQYAGAQCNPYFFGSTYQNDTWDEAAGKYAAEKGFKSAVLIAPNYPAGRDHLTGFKRRFNGAVSGEIYSKVGQLDYSAELAQMRAAKPEAVFFFLPGAMGINFIKQFVGSGLSKDITLVTTPASADEDTIAAVGEPMLGLFSTSQWSHDLPNAANEKFVAEFRRAYNRYPTFYAAQAYDAIMAMDAAVRDVKGDVKDKAAVLKALKAAKFESVRGPFKYGNNNFPVQDYYLRVIGKNAEGKITNRTLSTPLKGYRDAYFEQCPLKS
ncbi:ABC transporter substrate-binding protein [Variovorax sp. J22P168]|uniref:ABC transporter substrate-binding protein n=2 Tax=Variovorax jilinensis TaxID=3053513 RepID=UPI0025773DB4|nr:ABC transporter substrate-binding protein [Variovorax sp. J22P168]MDM0012966.1 ABC transporter substrate-binding protein [Variovorax sp. J22P168]